MAELTISTTDIAAALRKNVAGHACNDVVAQRRNRMPLDRQPHPTKEGLEVGRHPVFVVDVPTGRSAHRVDAGDADEIGEDLDGIGVHGLLMIG